MLFFLLCHENIILCHKFIFSSIFRAIALWAFVWNLKVDFNYLK